MHYVSPTEEELFNKYNPDLQKKSLANRHEKQQEFDEFVSKLKEYSKSDKPSMHLVPCAELFSFDLGECPFTDSWAQYGWCKLRRRRRIGR